MSKESHTSRREITPELLIEVHNWGRSPETLRRIREGEKITKEVNEELDKLRRPDPASFRQPIGSRSRSV